MKACLKIFFILTIITISSANDGLVSLANITITFPNIYELKNLVKDDVI